jgi:hypothetical protein
MALRAGNRENPRKVDLLQTVLHGRSRGDKRAMRNLEEV